MNDQYEHRKQIDARIKEGIDKLLSTGDVKESDFILNEAGDKMISIDDEEGVEIVYNYTKGTIYKYGDRYNQ